VPQNSEMVAGEYKKDTLRWTKKPSGASYLASPVLAVLFLYVQRSQAHHCVRIHASIAIGVRRDCFVHFRRICARPPPRISKTRNDRVSIPKGHERIDVQFSGMS
jgi:hypothetical protein